MVTVLWVPLHHGVKGNDKGSRTEIKSKIQHKMKERSQKQWEEDRKRRKIQRKTGEMRSRGRNRREETVIARLRFGHTGLNNMLFLIGKHCLGKCDCNREEVKW